MVISQGDIWWADLPDPAGSGSGFRRPVRVVQGDVRNRSRIQTVVCVPLTSNLAYAQAPGTLALRPRHTGLPKESVVDVSRMVALARGLLTARTGQVSKAHLDLALAGLDVGLGR